MRNLFIMGLPRGGTTVTRDLFRNAPGLAVLPEIGLDKLSAEVRKGRPVVWKSPANCMDGEVLRDMFPDAAVVYVVRDGRQNLAAHKRYLEVFGIDYLWGAYRGRGLKGFADLWNDFAQEVSRGSWFRLEDLENESLGEAVVRELYRGCGYPGVEAAIDFWKRHVSDQGRPLGHYPGRAMSLGTRPWQQVLSKDETAWINPMLLEEFGYGQG